MPIIAANPGGNLKQSILLFLLVAAMLLSACDGANNAGATLAPGAPVTRGPGLRTPTPAVDPGPGAVLPEPPARTVMVHLFEWTWPDIALECENMLGPLGYVAVQVSPPQEHVVVDGQPWWQRYQPVSYQLVSRSGDRVQFAEMVSRCAAVGVDIYVDAVINHMAGMDEGVGSAGTPFTHYDYPGLYTYDDFHHCGLAVNDDIAHYRDVEMVRTCELLNLADLDHSRANVRAVIAGYLNDLVGLGVAGFRLDAAKHMYPDHLASILAQVAGDPYIFQEVIAGGDEPITLAEYTSTGDVTEFAYGRELSRVFRGGRLAELRNFGEAWGMLPSTEAVVFVDNHDNQRGHGSGGDILMHRDGALYELAVIFMLGYPYGYPKVMSSFSFESGDDGPPARPDGSTDPVYDPGEAGDDCFDGWVCEHRWGPIAGMAGFHNFASPNFFTSDWWDNGANQIAFGRGDAGFLVINREDQPLTRSFQTSLAPGIYCNVIEGSLAIGDGGALQCSGPTITVDDSRQATISVPPLRAAAIHVGARLQ
jgi:alpha-amylase